MVLAKHPSASGEGLLVQLAGTVQVAQGATGLGEVADRGQTRASPGTFLGRCS
jgi:hypothetical protein